MSPVFRPHRPAVRPVLFAFLCLVCSLATAFAARPPQAATTGSQWPSAAPGLRLPIAGSLWVLDHEDDRPVLVQLKYLPTIYNGHGASNFFKEQAAPLIYRPKSTVEIAGAAATIRLHDTRPVFFLRDTDITAVTANEAPAQSANTQGNLSLVEMKTKKGLRILSSISYAPWGGHAKRSADALTMDVKTLPGGEWVRWQPLQDLKPAEYGITTLPRGQGLFPDRIYDFAIDPAAPPNADAVKPSPAK